MLAVDEHSWMAYTLIFEQFLVHICLSGPIFVKGVIDANPNAADKCLDALLAFLQNTTDAMVARWDLASQDWNNMFCYEERSNQTR